MSNDYDDDSDNRSEKLIQDRQERLEDVLDVFTGQAADVSLTPEMKREIAVHIANYHRVLSKFEGESVLSSGDIPDITPIRERLGRETKVMTQSGGWDNSYSYETRPAVDELGFAYLQETANDLEAAAKKLGFWPGADTDVDSDDFSEEDLVTLLNARGQSDAIEDAPNDILDRIVETEEVDNVE